ncbi:beta barrel domain-containing protein [Paenibacillus illinoisensis]|uniref:Uncharacterized protein n=1 Tax=Paenibacillus illinoisensis TaxID=59845 RepID=A0A2W0C8D6_9BACL|nr:hypothetical protein [Paenibacillus illinoisensis]PYY28307.1 Uncharacterized protein PIL02S_03458 [Paenibacillus illinoisensis]
MKSGDIVFLKAVGNNARYRNDTYVEEYVVGSIGRKYFDVYKDGNKSRTIKFRLSGLRQHTDYSPDWKLYFSMQEILDEEESERLSGKLREIFNSYGKINLTLDQLRRISQIVNEQIK